LPNNNNFIAHALAIGGPEKGDTYYRGRMDELRL
jgi:hypothetical protein